MAVWNSMLLKIITISLDVVKQHVRFIIFSIASFGKLIQHIIAAVWAHS